MLKPPVPVDETQRLLSLHSLRILDTPAEERYDRITRMAKRLFDVDICLVSLVDSDRQWFKSKSGLEACETPRDVSFCGHAINGKGPFVILDAANDERFVDNPLVTGPPKIRFYAGQPIRSPTGFRIGTLCIVDSQPREMSDVDVETLKDLAELVEDEIRVTSQVVVDDLTGVANRRGFHMFANHTLEVCKRTKTPAELAFFDLDGFKAINDTFGHAAGDEVLRYFAELLVNCFRDADAIGRLGGDEFAVLLVGSDGDSEKALNRLRAMAADADSEVCQRLDWSVGTVRFDSERHSTIESLLVEADSRMYDDKVRRRAALA